MCSDVREALGRWSDVNFRKLWTVSSRTREFSMIKFSLSYGKQTTPTKFGTHGELLVTTRTLHLLGRASRSNGCAPTTEWRHYGYGCHAHTSPGSRRPRFLHQVRCYLDGSWLCVMRTNHKTPDNVRTLPPVFDKKSRSSDSHFRSRLF